MKTIKQFLLVCSTVLIFSVNGNAALNNIASYSNEDSTGNISMVNKTFTASALRNKTVMINWSAAQRQGGKKFIIERSSNGAQFYPIGEMAAVSSISGIAGYSFTDAAPETGYNYYRLTQVDVDGELTVTNTSMIDMDIRNDLNVVQMSKTSVLTAQYLSSENAEVSVEITNTKGKTMFSKRVITKTGDNVFTIMTKDLVKGQYFLSVVSASGRHTTGFTK